MTSAINIDAESIITILQLNLLFYRRRKQKIGKWQQLVVKTHKQKPHKTPANTAVNVQ